MQPQLKQLGLTQLEKALPALYEEARGEQWTYETFMNRAIAAEIEGRDRRAAERRMTAARLPTIKTLEAFDFTFQPDLSERLLWELADLSFAQTATNVIFLGPAFRRKNASQPGAHSEGEGFRVFGFVHHAHAPGRGAGHGFLSGPGPPATKSLHHP